MSRTIAFALLTAVAFGFQVRTSRAAEAATPADAAAGEAPLVTVDEAPAPVRTGHRLPPFDGPWYANHEMPLRTDGNLPGKLQRFDEAGNLVPVRGRLYFIQRNHVIMTTMSEASGTFQVTGLDPGVYSVVVASPEGFGAFAIRILPSLVRQPPATNNVTESPPVRSTSFKDVANNAELFDDANITMTVPLIPPSDFQVVSQIVQEQTNNFSNPPFGAAPIVDGAASGGAGGSSGVLGTLLGAGGLAGGITAAATSGSSTTTTTSTPIP